MGLKADGRVVKACQEERELQVTETPSSRNSKKCMGRKGDRETGGHMNSLHSLLMGVGYTEGALTTKASHIRKDCTDL